MEENYLKKELYDLIQKDASIFEFIQAGSLDGIWYWDLENVENEWMSPKFWETLGYHPYEKKHLSSSWKDIIFPDDLEVSIENFIKHCQNPNHPYDQIVRYKHKNGSTIWIRCRGLAIRDESGKAIRMLGVHINLTELKETEKHHELVLDSTSSGIYVIDHKGICTYVNKHTIKLLGYQDEKEIIGKSMHDIIHHSHEDGLHHSAKDCFLQKSFLTSTVHNHDDIVWKKDGTSFPVAFSSSPKLKNGKIVGAVVTFSDISERKQYEEALVQSNQRFKTLFERAPLGYQSLDMNGCFREVNQTWLDMLGYQKDEVIGRWFGDFLTPKYQDAFKKCFKVFKELGKIRSEFELVRKNKEVVFIEFEGLIGYNENREFEQTYCILNDITERKKIELELKQNIEDLLKSQQIAHLGTWRLNVETNEVTWSEELYKMYDFDSSLPPPPYTEHMKLFTPESWHLLSTSLIRTKTLGIPYELELETVTKDGSNGWMWVRGEAEKDASGKIIAISGAAQNITDRVHAQKMLQESEQRFKALHNASFGGIAIHDQGLILECNQGLSEITGFSIDELVGMNGLLLIAPEYRDFVMNKILSGYEQPYETYGIRKNKETYPLKIEARNIPYKGKKVRVTEFRDMTELKHQEKIKKESEAKYQLLFETMAQGVVYQDYQGNITSCNPIAEKILGLSLDQIQGKTSMDPRWKMIDEDGKTVLGENHPAMIALRTKEKVGPVIRAVYRPETNDYVWLNIISTPLFIEGNEKPIEVYSTFENITEKVAKEKQLQESEENYRLLSTQMQLGLAVHEMIYNDEKEPIDYRFININPSFEHLTGLKKEHIIGKTVKDVLPETEDFWIQSYGRITKTGKPERFENYSNVLKRFYSVSAYSYKKDHFATIIEDITERKNNEIEREYLISHDHLTGLKNRRYFDQQVKLMDLQENYPLSIISFDINGLKIINDAFGHIYGDMLLKHVANVFLEVFQENCVVSRVGGDEFLILMIKTTEIKAKEKADEAQERIHEHRIKAVQVSLSYGIAVKNKNEKVSDLLIEAENKMYTHKLFETASHRSDSIKTILRALHEKNPREEIHSKRVSELCVKMGTVLKMDQNELQMLRTISHLHDIGKISIDDSILNKPGKLSNEEWEIIRKHPEIGFRIVSASKEYAAVGLDILSHHERYDGKGYPRGLANHEIPIRARIISLVDAYDAMTSDRPYRQAMTHQMAIEEIIKCANTQFDPTLVDVFVGLFKSDGST